MWSVIVELYRNNNSVYCLNVINNDSDGDYSDDFYDGDDDDNNIHNFNDNTDDICKYIITSYNIYCTYIVLAVYFVFVILIIQI